MMDSTADVLTVGVIADTHGLLRNEALAALHGVDQILHAGDVGKPEILDALAAIAPLTVVRGNVDRGAWADALPLHVDLTLAGVHIHMLHDIDALPPTIQARREADIVVFAHSHTPLIEQRGNMLFLNPGSAGPRRFRLPVTLARLTLSNGSARAERIDLLAKGSGVSASKA